jgi:hypothetical protein
MVPISEFALGSGAKPWKKSYTAAKRPSDLITQKAEIATKQLLGSDFVG